MKNEILLTLAILLIGFSIGIVVAGSILHSKTMNIICAETPELRVCVQEKQQPLWEVR